MDDMMIRVMRLASQGLYCSQIMMALALETQGRENPGLIRSLAGLAFGCGMGQGVCGVLSGAACVLALYAGKGGQGEEESPSLMPMLQELNEWFAGQCGGESGGITCEAILGADAPRTPQQKCGEMAGAAFGKVVELLTAHGFDPADPERPDEF
ncbi:MAG: C-GCAxxG-C-C family protein [Desulfarculaceae bacterium]|nr:C-GCAxxG-C-C family protein [Desulfarculaceae bacterium]MCF8074525.1 C-GCAxxG-C-C family protein [Desulfarculaceae bacterium]MCF8103797.1 C-GCAxxG-C-C family protein [Desulfarculaceae bacterium]MCF8118139.1 C-GCAxxG-C-C family protein [Desulfarculaceae bacterium]